MNLKSDRLFFLEKIILAVFLTVSAYSLFLFFFSSYFQIVFRYMNNLGEPPLSQSIRIFKSGVWPYHDLRLPPYSLVPYGPVFLWLGALSYDFFQGPFMGPRFVTFCSTVLTALAVILILRRYGVKGLPIFAAFLIFLSHPYVQRWNAQVNVDMTGIFFGVASFYCFSIFCGSGQKKRLFFILGIVCGTLGFFTKSSVLAPMAAFFLCLISEKKWKWAAVYAVCQAVPILFIYLAINRLTDGQYYFHTTYEISRRLYFLQFIYIYWKNAAFEATAPFLVTVFFLFYGAKKKEARLFYIYFLTALLMTVSLGKQGSDTNYLLEWCVVSSVAAGFMSDYFLSGGRPVLRIAGIFLFVMFAAQFCWWAKDKDPASDLKAYGERTVFYDNVSKLIQRTPGKILSEDMSLLTANNREIYYEPFPMGQMSYSGVWDAQPILDALDRREFSLAALYFYAPALRANRTFTERFITMFNKRYHFVARAEYPRSSQQLFFYAPNEK